MHFLIVRAMFLLFWVFLGGGFNRERVLHFCQKLFLHLWEWSCYRCPGSAQPLSFSSMIDYIPSTHKPAVTIPSLCCSCQWLAHGDKRSDWDRHSEQFKLEMKGTNHVVIYSQSLRCKYLGINLTKYLQDLNTEIYNTLIKTKNQKISK